ncbi:MAG: class I SAM-dependent methyltransferase [Nannocystis sp.]|nr:class I SAM-dependent methyltransferase [Nannocystis sp.]
MDGSAARPCPACGGTAASIAFVVDGYQHARCGRCASLFVTPLPDLAAIAAVYLGPRYHDEAHDEAARMRAEGRSRAAFLAQRGVRSALEVGCGPGYFLDAASELGLAVEAVDRAPNAAAARARGHRVHDRWFEEHGPPSPRFDAVAMWEVIEHVPDPRDTLLRARAWLRPGGLLALSTPSASGLPARLLGRRFPMVAPPEHLTIFSRRGLHHLLDGAGFQVLHESSFSGLDRTKLARGLCRFALGDTAPAQALARGLAAIGAPLVGLVDRAGFGTSFELYAVLA